MSSDPLSGPNLTLHWVNQRIGEIDQLIDAYLNGNHFGIVVEPGPNSDDRLAKIKITAPVPDALYMLIGEVAYHLRSSLDQMIIGIARANGVAKARNLYFPFAKDKRDFEAASTQRKMKGLPPDVIDMIAELEPFQGGNDRLWGLGPLANIDKHNTLVPVGALANVNVVRGLKISKAKTSIMFSPMSSLCDGLIISNLGPEGTIEFHSDGPHFELSAYVVFSDVAVFEGDEVGPTLHELAQRVEDIVRHFEAHCFGRQRSEGS